MSDKHVVEFTCPECRGPITKIADEGPPLYRCLVGHAYSPRLLLEAHYETEERQLWMATLALEESAKMASDVAAVLPDLKDQLRQAGETKKRQADAIRRVIEELRPFPIE